MINDQNPESFVDRDTVAMGTLKTEGRICIHGTLEGQVIAQDRVRISTVGKIRGSVLAKEALIEGQVRGPIEASEKIVITQSSDIESDVVSPCLNVEPGSCLKGHFIISSNAEERERLKKEREELHRKTQKKVSFNASISDAKSVRLIGDFCEWNESKAIPLNSSGNGVWTVDLQLCPGQYEYLLIVDDVPQTDEGNPKKTPNSFGGENSILVVQ